MFTSFNVYELDVVSLDSYSIKLVTQVWNCAFRWLYGVGKFTSTRHLFDNHGTMSMRFLLHCIIFCLYMHACSLVIMLYWLNYFCFGIMIKRCRICMRLMIWLDFIMCFIFSIVQKRSLMNIVMFSFNVYCCNCISFFHFNLYDPSSE